jgi:hypothetical protein
LSRELDTDFLVLAISMSGPERRKLLKLANGEDDHRARLIAETAVDA